MSPTPLNPSKTMKGLDLGQMGDVLTSPNNAYYRHQKPLLVNSTLAIWLLIAHTSQKRWRDFTVALSWKTSATIANVASRPLASTVDVAKIKAAIAAMHEARDKEGGAIKEVVH